MTEEASTGAATSPPPEAGWYPDPVRRAAYRYWNGSEWTGNTRGPAPTGGSDPMPAHGQAAFGEKRHPRSVPPGNARSAEKAPTTVISADPGPAARVSVAPVSVAPVSAAPVSVAARRRAGVPVLLVVVAAAATFLGGLALGALVLGDDATSPNLSSPASPPSTSPATTTGPLPRPTTTIDGDELERLGTALAESERRAEEAAAAVAAAQAQTAAAEGRAVNLETHVEALRSWFTADVLARAQTAFDREVARACAAAGEPTLENTAHTRNMEPAGTHADVVAAALACRSES